MIQRPASATATALSSDGARTGAGSNRTDPAGPRVARPAVPDNPASVTSPSALALSDAGPKTFAVTPHAASEPATLVAPSDIPQASSSGTGSSRALPPDQGQNAIFADRAAPTDRITPALAGLPKTTDGTPTGIVGPRPTEHPGVAPGSAPSAAIALPPGKAPLSGSGNYIRTDQASGSDAAPGVRTGPTDQITPALVGSLKTTDGTSGGIVRPRPAEFPEPVSEAATALPAGKAPLSGSGTYITTDQASGSDVAPGVRTGPTDQITPASVGLLKTTDGTSSGIVRPRPTELPRSTPGAAITLPPGKVPLSGSGTLITDQASGSDAAQEVQAAMGQGVPRDTRAAPDVASQARMAAINLPPKALIQRPASATATALSSDGARTGAGSNRTDPAGPRVSRPAVPDNPASVTSPSALSLSDAGPETFAATSHAASEPATLVAPSGIPHAISSGTGSSRALPPDQGQPAVFADRAAPTDQITPALVGLPKTTDSMSSGIVRPRPAGLPGAAPGSEITSPPGKTPLSGSGTYIRTDQASGSDAPPGARAAMGRGVPGDTRAAPDVASQAPMAAINLPPKAPIQRPASATDTAARSDGAQTGAGSNRADLAGPRDARLAVSDNPASVTSPTALSLSDTGPETFAVTTQVASEPAALVAPSDIPPAISSGTGSSQALPPDQGQPAVFTDRAAPTDQITPALVGILKATDGTPNVTIQLQPVELGQVRIRVDQTIAGNTHIDITVERPETLQLLQRDEPKLQQALDQVGVLSTGRIITFQVAPHDQIGAAASRRDNPAVGSDGPGQGQNGGAWRQNDETPRHSGRSPNVDQRQARPRWFRAGLDITA